MAKNSNFLFKLDLLILSLLLDEDCYGYEITKRIDQMSNHLIVPKVGTMCPVLHELLKNKYISSYEKPIGTKTRVYYHIEEAGKVYLTRILEEYDQLVLAINSIVHKKEK